MSIFRKYTFKYFIKERGIMPTVYSQIVQGNNHTHTHTHTELTLEVTSEGIQELFVPF